MLMGGTDAVDDDERVPLSDADDGGPGGYEPSCWCEEEAVGWGSGAS